MARRGSSSRGGIGCLALLILIAAVAGWLYFHRNWTGPGPATHPTTVVVTAGRDPGSGGA